MKPIYAIIASSGEEIMSATKERQKVPIPNVLNRYDLFPNNDILALKDESLQTPWRQHIEEGLKVLCVCFHGAGRSLDAAANMKGKNIKALYLSQGISGLEADMENDQKREIIISELARAPFVFITLWPDQIKKEWLAELQAETARQENVFIYASAPNAIASFYNTFLKTENGNGGQ